MKTLTITALSVLLGVSLSAPAGAEFSGDTKLSCEAILCLSSPAGGAACAPSLAKYFGFDDPKSWLQDRLNFLNICPTASYNAEMKSLVNDIANGAGRCGVDQLNQNKRMVEKEVCSGSCYGYGYGYDSSGGYCKNGKMCHKQIIWVVNNAMPGYCLSYINNPLTDIKMPSYVGNPNDETGKWVE